MVQFRLSACQKQIKLKNLPNKLEIIFIKENSNYNSNDILKELKENLINFFKTLIIKQTYEEQKNEVGERCNISSNKKLAIIDSDLLLILMTVLKQFLNQPKTS